MNNNEEKAEKLPLTKRPKAIKTVFVLMLLFCAVTASGLSGVSGVEIPGYYHHGSFFWICIIINSVTLTAACLVFLICALIQNTDKDKAVNRWWLKIPSDLFTLIAFGLCLLQGFIIGDYAENAVNDMIARIIFQGCPYFAIQIILLVWVFDIAENIKFRILWKNSLLSHLARAVGKLIKKLPFIWKTVVLVLVLSVLEFIVLANSSVEYEVLILWMIEKMCVIPAVLYFALMLNRLGNAGKEMAAGNLDYKVDTKWLSGECRSLADNLNSIADGMSVAIEEKIKSERMKTELITNVSHDIKTPLTSIINYSDLISKESTHNQKITEYSEVLLRQAERLKKLIEDLVEVSKASTGNLEVIMTECDADIFLSQTVGEYEQRIKDARLDVVISQPDTPVPIMADSRRMWRIFDNLMNNICKYSQTGTRVYLTLEEVNGQAVFTMKNISASALNIDASELIERFVRGDASRNTEGNGLGLSIAKSLTELQNGSFQIYIDGDLFKAVLAFPIVEVKQ